MATIRSNELLARLEIDYLDVKEKRLRWFVHVERSSYAIKTVLRHVDRRKAWAREAKDNMKDTYSERPS